MSILVGHIRESFSRLMFLTRGTLLAGTWQALERSVCRLLVCEGFDGVRHVGSTADGGADIIASKGNVRFLYQVKHWKAKVGVSVLDETIRAMRTYNAKVPVVVSVHGFTNDAFLARSRYRSQGIHISLVDASGLEARSNALASSDFLPPKPRIYQEPIVSSVLQQWKSKQPHGLVIMATGLGKTFVAGEAIRRISSLRRTRVLVLAHTNALVYQLEKAFWPFLQLTQQTVVWNSDEKPTFDQISSAFGTFACQASVSESIERKIPIPNFDIVLIDECHHACSPSYRTIIQELCEDSFLLGLTATPWRGDDQEVDALFGPPIASLDMVEGMRQGYLSNVDYRIYTDNIDWERLNELHGNSFSPKQINRTLFIKEWNDSVISELSKAWKETSNPRCIVFCGTIDHAIIMRDKINARGFCRAEALYSQAGNHSSLSNVERQRILCDFQDGRIQVVCAVDIFNEGIDVPDVNIVVFQRVTHSRRIFVQQLGRGLRISEGKDKVIVLDFVNDIRRFAATVELKDNLEKGCGHAPRHLSISHKVEFRRSDSADPKSESFLRKWLEDIASVADADEEKSILRFPPTEILQRRH